LSLWLSAFFSCVILWCEWYCYHRTGHFCWNFPR
jgi:hypothetical protein